MCRKHGHSLALTVLLVVAAHAWQYDPDFMANPNMPLQPPILPNYGMDPLGVFSSPMQMTPPPLMQRLQDSSIDFDPQLAPLQSNAPGAPRFAQQQEQQQQEPEVSSVVVQRRMGGLVVRPGEEMVPQSECREGEPGCGPAQVIETATTTTATPIDDEKLKEKREEREHERQERRERDERRRREKQDEQDRKKKEREEREEKRRKEREEREERDKKEREEREERRRREREEHEERQRERQEKRREEDENDREAFKDNDDDDDKGGSHHGKHHGDHHHGHKRRGHGGRRHRDGDKDDDDDGDDDGKDKKKSKCHKCSKCHKKKHQHHNSGGGSNESGHKDEGTIEHDGKTIHVVVSSSGGGGSDDDDENNDKDGEDCKKCGEDSECGDGDGDGDGDGEGGDDDEGGHHKEDPLIAEKKKEYEKLTQIIKKDEEEFSKEADWLTKALALIAELKQKTHNVQMHLNDMHKQMSLMEHRRQHTASELGEAEKKAGEEQGLHKLEKELDLLMSASNAANEKINMLTSRKAQYLAKIGEVRNMLQGIKLRHMMANPSAFQSMAENFRAPAPPSAPAGNDQQQEPQMEVVPQFR